MRGDVSQLCGLWLFPGCVADAHEGSIEGPGRHPVSDPASKEPKIAWRGSRQTSQWRCGVGSSYAYPVAYHANNGGPSTLFDACRQLGTLELRGSVLAAQLVCCLVIVMGQHTAGLLVRGSQYISSESPPHPIPRSLYIEPDPNQCVDLQLHFGS